MNTVQNNETRAKLAVAVMWLVVVAHVITLISGYMQFNLAQNVLSTGEFTMEELHSNDMRQLYVSLFALFVFILAAVFFLMWFYRAYSNLSYKVKYLEHSKGWAIGAWFVPVLNLFRPYQIMRELYHESLRLLRKQNIEMSGLPDTSMAMINYWWGFWVASLMVSSFSLSLGFQPSTFEVLSRITVMDLIADALALIGAVLAVHVIKNYSMIEEKLTEVPDVGLAQTADLSRYPVSGRKRF